jgi:hypothetical protein
MDADDVYERAVKSLLDGATGASRRGSPAKNASSKKVGGKKADRKRKVAKQTAGSR